MCESLLATVIQGGDAELEEAAAPYDQDSPPERAITTGWKCYEEGERNRCAFTLDTSAQHRRKFDNRRKLWLIPLSEAPPHSTSGL